MIKRYYSSYTGKQIDEAVKTIVENQIGIEDFSPELIAEIKSWIATGEGGEGIRELEFKSRNEFPPMGNPQVLYIATNEDTIYYWSQEGRYKVLLSPTSDAIVARITKNEADILSLQSQINNVNVLVSSSAAKIALNEAKIASQEASIQQLTNSLNSKADIDVVNIISGHVAALQELVGTRKEGETRNVFGILAAQEEILNAQEVILNSLDSRIQNNELSIAGLGTEISTAKSNIESNAQEIIALKQKLPTIETSIQELTNKDASLEANLAAALEMINGKVDKREGYDLVSLENIAKLERINENVDSLIKSVSKEFIISESGELSINQIEQSKVSGLEEALANIEGLHGLQINGSDLTIAENKKINIMFNENNFSYANNMVSLKPISLSDLTNPEDGDEIVLNGGNA